MKKDKLNYRLLNFLIAIIIAFISYKFIVTLGFVKIFNKFLNVLFPFALAFAVAYVLNPFVKYLQKKGVRKKLAITLIILVVLGIIVGIVWATLPLVYDQLILLSKSTIKLLTDLSVKYDINMGGLSTTIMNSLNNAISEIGTYISNGTISFLNKGVRIVTNAIIVLVVGIYFLSDMDNIRRKVKNFFLRHGKRQFNYIKKLDGEMSNYFKGLIIFMTIQLFEYSIIFRIVNHPNWLLLGILACVTTVIPYFGGYITNTIAVITAATISTPLFIATLVVCMIFPNIDGYVISPRVYGKTNNTNPVIAIFTIGLFGSLFGIFGILIAMPTYILIKASYEYYEDDIKEKISDIKDKID